MIEERNVFLQEEKKPRSLGKDEGRKGVGGKKKERVGDNHNQKSS